MSKDNRVILERRFVPKGGVFIKQGDEAYSAYLIQSGLVSVYSKVDDEVLELAQLGAGEICGEMALVSDGCRTASVKALEDCNLIVITRTAFEEKLSRLDPTIYAIINMLISRLKKLNDAVLSENQ
jgi:CRP-like cAMP-binding protein